MCLVIHSLNIITKNNVYTLFFILIKVKPAYVDRIGTGLYSIHLGRVSMFYT